MRLRRRLVNERHPDNDLSIPQMVVLGLLVRIGEQTVGDLARAERVQPPSMTRTVNCLESDGYVERRPHETDGRQVVVSITDAGRAAVLADRQRRDAWLSSASPGSRRPSAPPSATRRRSWPGSPSPTDHLTE